MMGIGHPVQFKKMETMHEYKITFTVNEDSPQTECVEAPNIHEAFTEIRTKYKTDKTTKIWIQDVAKVT